MIQLEKFPKPRSSVRWYHLVALLVVVAGIGVVVFAARTALVAEENLQAFFHANSATLEYIKQNDGQWPQSWDDLRAVSPESDFEWVAEHLAFDFNADPRKIAFQSPDTFTAIQPNQPCYVTDPEVQQLINALKTYHK